MPKRRKESVVTAAVDYGRYSYWLETCGDDLTPLAPLHGSTDADVAILGAGFTGLWTAYYLLERDPSLRVVIVERDIAGFGASGRNGGFLSASFPYPLTRLEREFGRDTARETYLIMKRAVDEVLRVLQVEGIDAHQHQGGSLRFARAPQQVKAIDSDYATYQRLGLGDYVQLLGGDEVSRRVNVSNVIRGIYHPSNAIIQPARLARGLARAVERKGGVIYERTEALDYEPGVNPRLITSRGDVRARAVVLAGEAYLSRLPKLRRSIAPFHSLITITEPLSDEQWSAIGWANRETIGTTQYNVNYHSRTRDGRIAFGGLGAPYFFNSRIQDLWNPDFPVYDRLRKMAVEWFPALAGVRFTHAWGGPFGMPRDRMPAMSYDPATGLAWACGYTGQGVTTANVSGQVLAALMTGGESDLLALPSVNHRQPDWEPEPLRWMGIRFIQSGYDEIERRAELTGQPPTGRSFAERYGWR
jgi:glycine/D-amino acid oxidase-like deaminating enzyme